MALGLMSRINRGTMCMAVSYCIRSLAAYGMVTW